jgi:uncharacterized protein
MLIVISKNKRVIRAQTGYGLEGYLPDGWLKHTEDSVVYKYLSKGSFYEGTMSFIALTKERIDKEGYSVEHNKELAENNKKEKQKQKEGESIFEQLLKILPWWAWVLIIVVWIIWFIIDPGSALWILLIFFSKDSDSGGSSGGKVGGGGSFGGGGSTSRW